MHEPNKKTTDSPGWAGGRGVDDRIRCAILAAGLGRRMEPLSVRYIPKPLFPLGGKLPMVETWVRRMVASGITDLSMNLCVLKSTIRAHFGDGAQFGARISYVEEETPSGTLGGVCKQVLGKRAKVLPGERPLALEPFLGDTVIAPSGDIVTNLGADLLEEMYDIHKQAGAAFSMVLVPIAPERRKDFGTAVLNSPARRSSRLSSAGRIGEFREKDPDSPSVLNNASIYFIEARLLRELDCLRTEASAGVAQPFYDFGKQVFPALLGKLPYIKLSSDNLLWGVQYDGPWFDVGQKRDYLKVNEQVLDGALDLHLPYEKLPWGYFGADVAIDFARVTIVPPVVIGNRCTIEPGATLGPYAVIGDDWTIGRGARISHSVLWERYPMFREGNGQNGDRQLSASEMRLIDRHEVHSGVAIEECIVVGGLIDRDIRACTVEVAEEGGISLLPIDYVPEGPRA
jgi:NDP-sugar pyrophosphorylase family protein